MPGSTETMHAYLAGVIDIAGHIGIRPRVGYRRRTDGRDMTYYFATIALSDASPVIPDLLQAVFPARRSQYKAKNRKQTEWHMWEADNEGAREPLLLLAPYLRLKRRQAELALSLIGLIESDAAGPSRPLTAEQEQARRSLYEEARAFEAVRPRRVYR
jgi:hypothetical protein